MLTPIVRPDRKQWQALLGTLCAPAAALRLLGMEMDQQIRGFLMSPALTSSCLTTVRPERMSLCLTL